MTRTLSEDLSFCYSLLFTGENELKKNCYMKALLCFERCRKLTESLLEKDSVYTYCFYRALRKESQALRYMGLLKRSFNILSRVMKKDDQEWHSTEKLLVLLQLYDLSEEFDPVNSEKYLKKLNEESLELKK